MRLESFFIDDLKKKYRVTFVINCCIKEIKRIWAALRYSLEGLKVSIKEEAAFRTEVILLIILVPLALWLPIDGFKKFFLIQSMALVVIVELINVAIECCVNYISLERHPLAKKIKDVASGAVFLCIVNSLGMWVWALWEIFVK